MTGIDEFQALLDWSPEDHRAQMSVKLMLGLAVHIPEDGYYEFFRGGKLTAGYNYSKDMYVMLKSPDVEVWRVTSEKKWAVFGKPVMTTRKRIK